MPINRTRTHAADRTHALILIEHAGAIPKNKLRLILDGIALVLAP